MDPLGFVQRDWKALERYTRGLVGHELKEDVWSLQKGWSGCRREFISKELCSSSNDQSKTARPPDKRNSGPNNNKTNKTPSWQEVGPLPSSRCKWFSSYGDLWCEISRGRDIHCIHAYGCKDPPLPVLFCNYTSINVCCI